MRQALLAKSKRNVTAIAGGTDLLVRLYDMLDRPSPKLLVLDGLKSLKKIASKKNQISIGPLATFDDIEQSRIIQIYAPQLVQAASLAGSIQIRNRATIGGNIANGSPAGDLIPPLYSLNATLEVLSIGGKHRIAIEKFYTGPGRTTIRSNELITSIDFKLTPSYGFFLRLATRQALAISKVSVAARIHIKNQVVSGACIALGAVAPTVIRAYETEKYLIGNILDDNIIRSASEMAKNEAHPIDDLRSTAEYRREMVAVLLRRGLTQIASKLR
jgi:xanthine dehydrogenase FAD-binding subunit